MAFAPAAPAPAWALTDAGFRRRFRIRRIRVDRSFEPDHSKWEGFMLAPRLMKTLIVAAIAATAASVVSAAETAKKAPAAAKAPSDAQLIASAQRAAPAKVSKDATIIAMDADGKMRTLRQGTNGFTCMADSPATPGPDPMCMDKNAFAWAGAWMAHKDPPQGKVGFMYMLEGGTDASNTDPFAAKPSASNHWVKTGPHIMVVGADPSFYDSYPKSPDPDTSQPYVMWAGTPYQHLMAPMR
jgi:hypothetical protein